MPSVLLSSPAVATEAFLGGFRLLDPVREATNNNDGRFVNAIQAIDGTGTGDAWCDSTVNYVGELMFGHDWPMPLTASCTESYAFAKAHGILVTDPQPGDLFFWMTAPGVSHHTGAVIATRATDASIPSGYVRVRAGNSGAADDQGVHPSIMPIAAHEFARWTMLIARAGA